MAVPKPEEIEKLVNAAKARRRPHEDEIEHAYSLISPARESLHPDAGIEREYLFDSTARLSARNLVTATERLLIPQNRPWAELFWRTDRIEEIFAPRFEAMRERNNDKIFKHFTNSNFFVTLSETLYDGVVAGTGCLAVIDIPGRPLQYAGIPLMQLYFLERYDGRVDAVFREHDLSVRQIVQRFPRIPESLRREADDNPAALKKVLESAIPTGNGKFYTCVHLMDGMEELDAATSRWNPYIVWRWEKSLGQIWGDSPGRQCLPHCRTVNQMVADMLAYSERAAHGLWQTRDETFNAANTEHDFSGGTVVISEEPIDPLPLPGNFQITLEAIEAERQAIKRIMLDISLPPDSQLQYMKAEAVAARRAEYFNLVGEPAQRLQWELLAPVAEQVIGRLKLRGELEHIPPEEVRALAQTYALPVDNESDLLEVRIDAAIAQAMKNSEAQTDVQALALLLQSGLGEQIQKTVNLDAFVRKTLRLLGFSQELLRTEEEVQQLEQQQQLQQASQQITQSPQAVEALTQLINPQQ